MEIKFNLQNPTSATLTVCVKEADYQTQVNSKLKDYAKKASIKGFRPGKVPPAVIKNMMGESILVEEVFSVISQELNGYIKEQNLSIIGDPLPNEGEKSKVIDWKKQTEFEFTYDLGIIPEFDVKFDGLSFEAFEVEVDDNAMNEALSNIKKQFTTSLVVDEIGTEDYVTGILTQIGGDISVERSMIPMNKVKDASLLTGKKVGEELTLDLNVVFGGDAEAISHVAGITKEEAAELATSFTYKIEKITRIAEGELNQELFDKVFGKDAVSSEEEFLNKIKESISENYQKDSQYLLSKEIKEKLIDATALDYSKEFFKRWILETNKESANVEEIDNNFPLYEKELKWSFLRDKIAKKAEIKVSEVEVRAKAEEFVRFQYLGGMEISGDLRDRFNDFVDKYLKEDKGRNYMQTFDQVLNQKVLDYIQGEVKLNTKKVGSAEFQKIAEEATKATN